MEEDTARNRRKFDRLEKELSKECLLIRKEDKFVVIHESNVRVDKEKS